MFSSQDCFHYNLSRALLLTTRKRKRDFVRIAYFIATVIWSVVGLIFWIPILARNTTAASIILVMSALKQCDKEEVDQLVQYSIRFYAAGFENIWSKPEFESAQQAEKNIKDSILKFILESCWAVLFYSALVVVVGRLIQI